MKPGDLCKIKCSNFDYILAWSLQNEILGDLNNGDVVIYLKNHKMGYSIVISEYGLCYIRYSTLMKLI
jgi:hypothetical protein